MGVDYNVVFPETISQGAVGGPEYFTDVVRLRSGSEVRNTPWADPLRRYDAGLGIRYIDDLYEVHEFTAAVRGQLRSFRFKDWSDYKTSTSQLGPVTAFDQDLGVGDGTTYYFRLNKKYADDYKRRIFLPRYPTVKVAINGVEQPFDSWFVDDQNGILVFLNPPTNGAVLTWGGEFDTPVRFDSDYTPLAIHLFNQGTMPSIGLVEERLSEDITEQEYLDTIEVLKVYSKTELYDLANIYDYTVNTHWEGFWNGS